MKTFIISVLWAVGITLTVSAQSIQIYTPHFAGKEYVFCLNQGIVIDTIQSGVVGEDGRLTITIPDNKKEYVGIGSWTLNKIGGVNFVINNEDFSLTCAEAALNGNNLIYENSVENAALKDYQQRQSVLFQEIRLVFQALETYANNDSMRAVFERRLPELKELYESYQQELINSPLYAAFYTKTLNFINGIGPHLYEKNQNEIAFSDAIHFVTEGVNIERLYTSGLWNHFISLTFNMFPDKKVFGESMVKMLQRTTSQAVFEAFANDLITICVQFDWPDAEEIIINYLAESERLPEPRGLLREALIMNQTKVGTKAPKIKGQKLSNVLLVFYTSGCDHCVTQLKEIIKHYDQLKAKKIRVVSQSLDHDKVVFDYHSKEFPWPDKLFDPKGQEGEVVKKYGILGTPTIYLIDKNGVIVARQAKLEDIKELNLHSD